jgi:two-component system, sensor histidine kinase and response regulator
MILGVVILVLSAILQFAAAFLAFRLMQIKGRRLEWGLIATGIGIMAIRRGILVFDTWRGEYDPGQHLTNEIMGLIISALLFAGLAGIAPLFRAFSQSEADLRKAHAELEQRVLDRTAALLASEKSWAAANEDLQQERYLLHTLMDYLPHNIYFKDANSRFIRINKSMARYFKLQDPSDAIGKTDHNYFTDEHALQALADEQEILRSGQGIVDKEEKETWPDGRTTWASSTKLPLYDDAGQVVGTFGISQDISAQKRVAEALRAAKEAAEAASQAKSTFLANMSHEIRTPLNAVIGMTELVLKSQLTPRQREFLSTVRDSGEALLSVINDILDFSKIEAEKLVLHCERFHLRESLGDTMKSFAIRAHQQGLELACHVHEGVPAWVVGDYPRLRQVVVNLVNNAIKFTQRGEVVLEVAREPDATPRVLGVPGPGTPYPGSAQRQFDRQAAWPGDGNGEPPSGYPAADAVRLHFTVSDTGIGIPESKFEAVFGMFEQADSSTTRRYGGTGLGLAIASRLVGLMGGRIWVESQVGVGSRFHFTVLLGQADAAPEENAFAEPVCVHGMRVLVVDDNATNRRILDEMFASWQMRPTSVASAAEAVQHLRDAEQSGQPYTLVITDAHMPEIDGFTLAGRIRDRHREGPVIMMLTSGDHPSDLSECERLGIAAYLLKPIKQSELLEAVQLALGITGKPRMQPGQHEYSPRCRGLRILLAEDSLVNQQLAVALLEEAGHSVTVACNGREAVAAAESDEFQLMLMDVQMPEMDGLEATALIRARERATGRHLPIIAMTAHALDGDCMRCLDAGMDGYTAKPIDADELFAQIDSQIKRFSLVGGAGSREQGAGSREHVVESREQGVESTEQGAPNSTLIPCSELPAPSFLVDWDLAVKAVRGDKHLLETIVQAALEEIPDLLAAVRRAVGDGDCQALRLAAHTLKGSIRYFGAPAMLEPAQRLEALGQANRLEGAAELLPALEQSAQQVMSALRERILQGASPAAVETQGVKA